MTTYPLAHDENGVPLDVPAGATGWLVRKHSGGKGRPAAVYDADGRPLVLGLDATAADLRTHGCKPGHYRLQAVDGGRKPLDIVAFTEVIRTSDMPDDSEATRTPHDAVIAALARSVEAMQRVQAERERVQAEMFTRLIERLAPPPPQPASDFRNVMANMLDFQKNMKKLSAAATPPEAELVADDEPAMPGFDWMALAQPLMAEHGPKVFEWLWKLMGLSKEEISQLGAALGHKKQATPAPSAAQPQAVDTKAVDMATEAAASERDAKVAAIFKLLDESERAELDKVLPTLSKAVQAQIGTMIDTVTPEQGAAMIRQHLAPFLKAKAANNKPKNGVSS